MIQCVGSRNEQHPWCSRVCCSDAVKNAIRIRETSPGTTVFVLYRDMRTYAFREEHYERARELGVVFLRYHRALPPRVERTSGKGGSGLTVTLRDLILNEDITLPADLVALSPAIVPRPTNAELGRMLKVPLNEDGFFLEAHVKLRPVDFATEGIFLAGMAHSPMTMGESIAQANAAAARACTIISRDEHITEANVAHVTSSLCIGCGLCVEVCPYPAIELRAGVAEVTPALCKGCGLCAATCRSGAVQQQSFADDQILAMIRGFASEVIV